MSDGLESARLSVLVHEVRSPVAALSAVSETIGDSPSDSSMRRELVRLTLAACRGIERIVMDLAVASVRLEPLDAGALVQDAAASFSVRGAHVLVYADEVPLSVEGDPVRLRQALDNLITNALVHGDRSAVVTVRATRSESGIEIAVSDQGSGIPAEALERIFDVGVRLDDGAPGSGLGLALTRAIVDAHGATLEVASTPDQGTTFTIVLPGAGPQPDTCASSS